MTPQRWARIKELFGDAFERPEAERAAFLDSACDGDAELRVEVDRLLAESDGDSLHSPTSGFLNATHELAPGDTVAHYRIEARLGEGGMGVVYKASDTRLRRSVALKIVKAQFSSRSQREARAVAALNHPNICTLHDVGPNYLVMELIEGPTLAERIGKGAIPIQEALNIARQIAEALEAAHEKGIVHRDLKPANIKLTADGTVKVLDFGLAKELEPAAGSPEDSPTLTATQAGMILGTAAYMSPEQAAGKTVDKRADIWSFGVVLWEMLTGKRLFAGETVTLTLAEVLRGLIDFDQLPRETPSAIRVLLHRCLDRDVKQRLRDIGEARIAIKTAFQPPDLPPAPKGPRLLVWIGGGTGLALALALLVFFTSRETPRQFPHTKFLLSVPEGDLVDCALSPDGRFLAFSTVEPPSVHRYWVRSLDGIDFRMLSELRGVSRTTQTLFWSPDSENIGFQSADKLYRIPRNGGPAVVLANAPERVLGGLWLDGGVILFGTENGLFRISSSGGAAVRIDNQQATLPAALPGRRFLYRHADGIFAASLDGGTPVKILPDKGTAAFVPPSQPGQPGHLLFVRGETLMAQLFNPDKLALEGAPIPVAEQVGQLDVSGIHSFTVSSNGVLVIARVGGSQNAVLTWLDRRGKTLRTVGKPFRLAWNPAIRLSPDDSRAIVTVDGPSGIDLWIADLNRETFSRFTFDGSHSGIWSPDGRQVLWAANDGKRYLKPADGSGKDQLLYQIPDCGNCYVEDWSADGKTIATVGKGETVSVPLDTWFVAAEGKRVPYNFLQSRFATYWAQISPDNHWLAYVSDQYPYTQQVFVESIPRGKALLQISTEIGDWPVWRRDGKELFFRQDNRLMAAPIHLTDSSLSSDTPQPLFVVPPGTRFQVSRDGQRFLIAVPTGEAPYPALTIDTDWRAGLVK